MQFLRWVLYRLLSQKPIVTTAQWIYGGSSLRVRVAVRPNFWGRLMLIRSTVVSFYGTGADCWRDEKRGKLPHGNPLERYLSSFYVVGKRVQRTDHRSLGWNKEGYTLKRYRKEECCGKN